MCCVSGAAPRTAEPAARRRCRWVDHSVEKNPDPLGLGQETTRLRGLLISRDLEMSRVQWGLAGEFWDHTFTCINGLFF